MASDRRGLKAFLMAEELRGNDRGGVADISADAKVDERAAAAFRQRREATLVENESRRQRRDGCLRDSALAGGGAGTVGASLAFMALRRPGHAGVTGKVRWWSLLGIGVNGKAMGGAMQAFVVWMGFFMPFMLTSNLTRWRCQKKGISKTALPPRRDSDS